MQDVQPCRKVAVFVHRLCPGAPAERKCLSRQELGRLSPRVNEEAASGYLIGAKCFNKALKVKQFGRGGGDRTHDPRTKVHLAIDLGEYSAHSATLVDQNPAREKAR
jgi:hypothetical protein